MIHPETELRLISPEIGYGVFAKSFIPKGTIVYIKDKLEIEISPQKYRKLDMQLRYHVDRYSYRDERGKRIISWDNGKYVNHSCDSNTISTGYGFEIAIRDILPGDEITDEYGIFNLDITMDCACGAYNCRKTIKDEDFDVYYSEWDEKIKSALQTFNSVEQPLLPVVAQETINELTQYFETNENYKSVYHLRLKPKKAKQRTISIGRKKAA